jgi:hypothetical protein
MLPKKGWAEQIGDFSPISLIHSIAKVVAKAFAIRLTRLMDMLVSNA